MALGLISWSCSKNEGPVSSTESQISPEIEMSEAFDPALESAVRSEFREGAASVWTGITAPTTITEPGFYRVTADFSATGDGIVIMSDNVFLKLGGHEISGPGNKIGRGIVLDGVKNVWVQDGRVSTFGIGVVLLGSSRSVIRGIKVEGGDEFADPANGIAPQIGLLAINSYANIIFRNYFDMVNLGIFVRGAGSYENRIFNNASVGGHNGLLGICYNPAPNEGPAGPSSDYVTHNYLARFGNGIQASAGSMNNMFNFNVIKYFNHAYVDFNGSNSFEHNRTRQIEP